jgi:hypothetical protein
LLLTVADLELAPFPLDLELFEVTGALFLTGEFFFIDDLSYLPLPGPLALLIYFDYAETLLT